MQSPAAINEAQFDALASWFTSQPDALAQCYKPGYEFPTTEELESRVPKSTPDKPIKVGRQSNDEPLQMAFVPAKKVLAEAGLMILQTMKEVKFKDTGIDERFKASNKEYRAMVVPMHTDELMIPELLALHGKGHCFTVAMSSRSQITRRMYTSEHPRMVPVQFNVPGAKANKIYVYHLWAFAAAYIHELDPDYFAKLGCRVTPLNELQMITKGKKQTSLVLRHLCGNMWCISPFHTESGTKEVNDEEEHCHHFLRETVTMDRFLSFRNDWCLLVHAPRELCWTNVYNQKELNSSRLSLEKPPRWEIEEDEDAGDE